MVKIGKRARRMSIDTNLLSVECLKDMLAALKAEQMRNDERGGVPFNVAATLIMEVSWLRAMIKQREVQG